MQKFVSIKGSSKLGLGIRLLLWTHGDQIYVVTKVDSLVDEQNHVNKG